MATTRFIDHLLEGIHSARPAASAVPQGTLYSCTTHTLIYQSDGTSTWSTWFTGAAQSLDAIIAASAGEDIADALAGAAAPDAGNVFATMADVGSGGSDLVQTNSGAGSVYVPGMRGSADVKPASPNAADDEFEALSGWTTLGTLDTSNVSDVPSNWHVKRTLGAIGVDGIYKTAPTMPFTVTAKLTESNVQSGSNYNMAGILLTEASPGKLCTVGFVSNSNTYNVSLYRWTNRSTFATNIDVNLNRDTRYPNYQYIRLVVTSSTNVSAYISQHGIYWIGLGSISGVTTSLTVANVGLCIGDAAAAGTVEAIFDWIRFT